MTRTKTAEQTADPVSAQKFAPLDDEIIKEMTDSGSFSRGRSYFRQGAISQPSLRSDTISAACQGSEYDPYHVTAKLAPAGAASPAPLEWSCTCPRGGFCKHVVALLLTWIDEPHRFVSRPDLKATLREMDRETLLAIIERMIKHDPELVRFVELPVVSAGTATSRPNEVSVSAATITRQVEAAMQSPHANEWGASRHVATEIATIIDLGKAYQKAGAWADAAIVFAATARAIMDGRHRIWDDDGEVLVLVADCDQGLSECLDIQTELPAQDRLSPEQRMEIIRAIFDIWHNDVFHHRGVEIWQEGPEVVARLARAEERQLIGEWLNQALIETERADEWSAKYIRRAVISFQELLAEQSGLSDEQRLKMYQDAELWPDVVSLLLAMERTKEAIGVAARKLTVNFELIGFADQLFATGSEHQDEAVELIDSRLWEGEGKNPQLDMQLLDWLQSHYARLNRPESMLTIAKKRFQVRPGTETYLAVKTAATMPGQPPETWSKLQSELQKNLTHQQAWASLVEIALEDKDISTALAAYARIETKNSQKSSGWYGGYYPGGELAIRIANAAEATQPDDAIRLYEVAADRMIAARGRPSYQQAAMYLQHVQRLLTASGRLDDWTALIGDIRSKNKTLRALREELDAHGLR